MCDVISQAMSQLPPASRRGVLKALGAGVAGGGLLVAGGPAAAATQRGHRVGGARFRTRVVLLGTAGGPIRLGGERSGISTAVVYEDRVYIVDLGAGAGVRLAQSGLGLEDVPGSMLSQVRGIFFTHLHSDHVTDWPHVYLTARANTFDRTLPAMQVYGPGDRGTLPRVFPPGRPSPPVYHPEDPTPGTVGMTGYLDRAFAQDVNDRSRDNNVGGPGELFSVHDIDLEGVWDIDPEGKPPRLSEPLHIWTDGDVRITATLVDHHPTAPSFGYRFDTPDGSVVISGDTTVSENLIDLARDCDYLVHEVIDAQWVDQIVAPFPDEVASAVRQHLLGAHTTIEQVGRDVAEPAGAKNLVLTHLAPATNSPSRWRRARRGYSGSLIVGEDLMELGVGSRIAER
ncbi:MBL fold metallo-hydrolase [Pimelobacter simplex]|uniref:MBL fold metallo-hydrolase n=1 Tax=Nocardioides simplex TaxID=2045 RepID=UPI001932B192|nr:MBL fold metallo-hydrolase [Pimelobacter simplex]